MNDINNNALKKIHSTTTEAKDNTKTAGFDIDAVPAGLNFENEKGLPRASQFTVSQLQCQWSVLVLVTH